MCKIITIINKNNKNCKKINEILNINADALKSEQSGYSVLRNNEAFYFLNYKYFNNNIRYLNEKVYILHTRTATAGSLDIDGLHLKNINGFFWAHNGFVSKFADVKDFNDSYYFFNNLINKSAGLIDKKAIEKEINESEFSGRGVLYNPYSKELFLFATNSLWVYGLDDCLIFTSFELNLKSKKYFYKNILGLTFVKGIKEKEIKGIKKQKFEKIFIKFKNDKLDKLEILEIIEEKYKLFNSFNKFYDYEY
ncbi:MAG: hypothetical protein N2114_05275 [Candidatus Goldbacteria bacterium]|nr:hypothetical protein [Candidatus Goldiibacteriota bacterium]